MLPINTQASSTEDRHIIAASLKRQEEEAYKQTKILEKLADEFGKQRRASTKQNTNKKAETSTKGPGFLDMPLQDLKQMFIFDSGYKNKQNKQNIVKDIPQNFKFDSGQKSKNKQDTNDDETNEKKSRSVFKNMIENITDSNVKNEISEKRKKLDNIVETSPEEDKVKKSVEIENEEPTSTERKKHVPFSQKIKQSFSEKMTSSMAGATTKDFGELLTTKEFKAFTQKQTDRIVDALEGLDIGGGGGGGDDGGIGMPGVDIDLPDGPDGKNNKGGRSKPNKGSRTMRKAKIATKRIGRSLKKLPVKKLALGAASGFILYEGLTHMEDLNAEEDEDIAAYREEHPELFKKDEDILNDPNASKEAKLVAQKNIKLQQDIGKYGEEEARNREIARNSVEEKLKQRKVEKAKIGADREDAKNKDETGKPLQKRKWSDEAGPQAPLTIPMELGKSLKKDSDNIVQRLENPKMDETGKPLEPVAAVTPKLLDTVTDQKQELEDTKAATAPITVINNNTNNVGGGGGQSMSFASASAVNNDTAINDFFRSHGRIFA